MGKSTLQSGQSQQQVFGGKTVNRYSQKATNRRRFQLRLAPLCDNGTLGSE